MSENKRVSVNAVEAVMKKHFSKEASFDWYGNTVVVKKVLPLKSVFEFVQQVVNSCYDDDDYMPEMKDFAIRACTIEKYTNVALPKNSENMYMMMYGCDLFDTVIRVIDKKQFDLILDMVDDKINYMQESKINEFHKMLADAQKAIGNFKELSEAMNMPNFVTGLEVIANQDATPEKMLETYIKMKEEAAEKETEIAEPPVKEEANE